MKKKCLSLFVLLSFLVLQVLSPIGGKEAAVSAADGDKGIANLDYTFESVDGTSVSTKSDSGQTTVLIFSLCTYSGPETQRTVKSIAESQWIGRSDIRVIFAEVACQSLEEVQSFAATYGCDDITFCYDSKTNLIGDAAWAYFHLFSSSNGYYQPLILIIDGENQVRHCLTGEQTADTIIGKIEGSDVVESPTTPSQAPAQGEGVANLDYTFQSVDGTSVSTSSNSGQATVLIFGSTTCVNTQRTLKSIAASQWVGRSDIRVIFAETSGQPLEEVQSFAATYGCNNITFCYDEGHLIGDAMWEYYFLFYEPDSLTVTVTMPVIMLIDGNNRVRDYLTAYQKEDAIMNKMQAFVAAEPTATPSQEPAQKPKQEPSQKEIPPKNSTIQDASGNTYQVTQSGNGNGTVTYAKAESSQAATVKVPSKVTIDGVSYDVTSVSAKAFRGNVNLKKVTIGKNVTSIGNSAFEGCTALKSIVIPSKVKSIGKSAFKNCKSLKSIRIKGNALKTVGKNAFKGIHAKAKIKVPKKQLKTYEKRLKGKGQKKTVKIIS